MGERGESFGSPNSLGGEHKILGIVISSIGSELLMGSDDSKGVGLSSWVRCVGRGIPSVCTSRLG